MNKPVFRKNKVECEYHCILSPNLIISVFNDCNHQAIMTSDSLVEVAEAFNEEETEETDSIVFSKNYNEVLSSIKNNINGVIV